MQPISISFLAIALSLAAANAMPAMENANGIAAWLATPSKTGSSSTGATGGSKPGPGGESDSGMDMSDSSSQTTLTCSCKPAKGKGLGSSGLDSTVMRRRAKGSTGPLDSGPTSDTMDGGGKGAEGGKQKYTLATLLWAATRGLLGAIRRLLEVIHRLSAVTHHLLEVTRLQREVIHPLTISTRLLRMKRNRWAIRKCRKRVEKEGRMEDGYSWIDHFIAASTPEFALYPSSIS